MRERVGNEKTMVSAPSVLSAPPLQAVGLTTLSPCGFGAPWGEPGMQGLSLHLLNTSLTLGSPMAFTHDAGPPR